MNDEPADLAFEAARPSLLGVAYRMTGSLADAEDLVQETWLRWRGADRAAVANPAAWLTTAVTRLAIDSVRRRRRTPYVGPWLAEPIVAAPGPEEQAELAETLALGFLTVLERLAPVERAVFILADVFSVPFADIAAVVDKTPAACRQIASRARRRVQQDRPGRASSDRQAVDGLLVALASGDVAAVVSRLAPDVVCLTDGGPLRRAARRPVVGPARVARFVVNLARRFGDEMTAEPATVNGEPGVVLRLNGQIDSVASFAVADGLVAAIHLVRNPDKLARVAAGTVLV